ncbi:hypothetical protein HAX54_052060, partial [Datura stramonium]|nr:hypothetical protein [Datura stramonium]
LLTKDRMHKMNIPFDDDSCGLCEAQVQEITDHWFMECKWITKVRESLDNGKASQCVQ